MTYGSGPNGAGLLEIAAVREERFVAAVPFSQRVGGICAARHTLWKGAGDVDS